MNTAARTPGGRCCMLTAEGTTAAAARLRPMLHRLPAATLVFLLAACSAPTEAPIARDATPAASNSAPAAETAQTPRSPADGPAAATPALAVEGEGLRLFDRQSGSARPLAFGLPRDTVISALAFRGEPGIGTNGECGAGPLDTASWPDGLTLYFQGGKFVGWAADRRGNDGTDVPAIITAANVGPGSTRAELESAYSAKVFESTLGTEFSAGDLFGVLDGTRPTSRITAMWAGASCNMR